MALVMTFRSSKTPESVPPGTYCHQYFLSDRSIDLAGVDLLVVTGAVTLATIVIVFMQARRRASCHAFLLVELCSCSW